MSTLTEKARRAISLHRMVEKGRTVLAAVSGGPDSVAMLHVLVELAPELGITLAVAHLDHGFRPESADEAAFVKQVSVSLGLPFFSEEARLKEALASAPANRQAAAREARYAFFERAALLAGAHRVAIGHTADDQAETCLMREVRGSGAQGLASIPPVRGIFVRPLIDATRDEVMEYLSEKGLPFVTDPTNLKPDYLRNRVRMELIPLLKSYNPRITEALCHSADILREEDAFLTVYAEDLMQTMLVERSEGSISLDIKAFLRLPPAVKRRVLRQAIMGVKGSLSGIGYGHIIEAARIADESATGRGIDIPGGVRIETSYGRLLITRHAAAVGQYSVPLNVPGTADAPQAGVSVESVLVTAGAPAEVREKGMEALFDLDRLSAPLWVRNRRDGDFFYPVGMTGRKKLSDYFVDMKLSRQERARTPILACGGDVAWVMGMRQDRRFAADGNTKRKLMVRYKKSC